MKDQATHIRLIRDHGGKPIEAEYMLWNTSSRATYEWQKKFDKWAEANRIQVTGDWPTDRNVFALDEVEEDPCPFCCFGTVVVTGAVCTECYGEVTHIRLKAQQEEQPTTLDALKGQRSRLEEDIAELQSKLRGLDCRIYWIENPHGEF